MQDRWAAAGTRLGNTNNTNNNNKKKKKKKKKNSNNNNNNWCAWYSEEGYGRKHQESIRESYYERDSKDLHAGICANPQKGAQCMKRMIDFSD